ncbi:Sodium- and chloride-dependent creatine transporter 1 [Mactra antiquata]
MLFKYNVTVRDLFADDVGDGVEMESFVDGNSSSDNGGKVKKRETWSRKIDFLIACCGFSIGLGNVWKFPFLCYRNGGGAFLIPYFICVLIGGIPTFFLEVAVGQFMSEGGLGAWKICPLFQGIGLASAVIVFLVNCDYNILLTWGFYYFFASMTTTLPWSHCDNDWNTEYCTTGSITGNTTGSLVVNSTLRGSMTYTEDVNSTTSDDMINKNMAVKSLNDPVTEFWERKVLDISSGVHEAGVIKWDLCLCLLLAWIVVYFCIWKGIKGSGKVMYFTVTSPYILMIILLIRGVTLDGALEGIKFYLIPNFAKLAELQVWADAGNQVFYSYSLSLGTLIALGSYNKFNHHSYRDCFLFACMNSITSIMAGFVIFSVLGFMAYKQNVSIEHVAESGPGLAFIAYPEAVSQMPLAPFWSAVFFLMIILLGLDSQFVGVEGIITCIVDFYPNVFRKGYRREVLIAVVCLVSFLIGLSMVTQFLFVVGVISYSELTYDRKTVVYHYPQWAIMIGWVMALASIVWIPIFALYRIYEAQGTFLERVREAIKPKLRKHQLRPNEDLSKITFISDDDEV